MRLTPLQQKLAGLEKALPTAMAKQGTALVLSVAVMLAAFVGFGGARSGESTTRPASGSPPAFRPTTAMPERGADHPCQHGSEYHHHRRKHAGADSAEMQAAQAALDDFSACLEAVQNGSKKQSLTSLPYYQAVPCTPSISQ